MKVLKVIYFASTQFYLLAFMYVRYANALNGYLILYPATVSFISLIILTISYIKMKRNLEEGMILWSYFLFSVAYTFFAINFMPE